MAPEMLFMQRFKFTKEELDEFFNNPVWQEVERMMFCDINAHRNVLENANPSENDSAAKILRAQGRLETAKRFYGLRAEFMLHCVAKEDSERSETARRVEQWIQAKTVRMWEAGRP